MNQSFGQLHIGSNRGSRNLSCNFVILNMGISQAVSLVWIQDLYLSYGYAVFLLLLFVCLFF